MKVWIAPSLLAADFARLAEAARAAEEGGADLLHVDVMDGHFVPTLTIGPPVVAALRRVTGLPLDVHLMIERPENSIAEYLAAGADWISVHVESTHHLQRCLDGIRRGGARAGAVINPGTPTSSLAAAWPDLDYAVVMSVNPGRGGQSFLPQSVEKVRRLKAEALEAGSDALLEVDGGGDAGNARGLIRAGAEILVAGTAIYGERNVAAAIDRLKAAASEGVRV
ncbi:MAG: ribulose-phosphate 3-epimerase [Thermoanaerobaculia bacterium]